MSHFLAELIGTLLLILLGNGVVANVVLNKSKGQNSGWIVIATGWALAVMIPAFIFGSVSGAHLNPAVTLGFAAIGKFSWNEVPTYIAAQFIGAFIGAVLVWLMYLPHWEETEDKGAVLGSFSTGPAIRNNISNFISEFIGTAVLTFGILGIVSQQMAEGLGALVVGGLIWSIGISLGGPTGYAINPARDLAPRIAHAILPIKGKGSSDWGYAWIPVIAPIVGGIAGAVLFKCVFGA
ncbi:MIP/aquaporin family protein [Clostridium ganghwense]|uniref:Aquaporin family protein n=1 Tax=Clostridium ganghwense TaxID=312089 RepID=A0ABT4CP49_9CLOT|nr:MIP/aquaporin family protein [Clostridium ganghwense]MCY6370835.1 aquaporin family protein [Clostridium ganghwense]